MVDSELDTEWLIVFWSWFNVGSGAVLYNVLV